MYNRNVSTEREVDKRDTCTKGIRAQKGYVHKCAGTFDVRLDADDACDLSEMVCNELLVRPFLLGFTFCFFHNFSIFSTHFYKKDPQMADTFPISFLWFLIIFHRKLIILRSINSGLLFHFEWFQKELGNARSLPTKTWSHFGIPL